MSTAKKRRKIPYCTAVAAVVCLLAGCFPARRDQAGAPAPVIGAAADSEYAYWRGKYVKNRMVPPAQYSLMPKAPRNNAFGEFDDGMYSALDRQPELPALPGDEFLHAMAAPAPSLSGAPYPVTSAPGAPAGRISIPAGAAMPQGIVAENHFYPVEQLVYGGDYAEPDSPDAYRLMPKDEISVTVRNHLEFSGKLTLQPDGTVRIPNTPDPVHLRGRTADEAADEIRKSLAVYVKGDCVVRVQANRARGGYYFVFGDVKQPGRFPMGMEPIRLSDAVMAANFEASPNRPDRDGELGPAFPAASPTGASVAPRTADMARVMLITPHRSQPSRTVHDLRQAMLGMTAGDPPVRPGQIIVVPSLDPEKNRSLGLELSVSAQPQIPAPPEGLLPGQGFSGANSPERLPDVLPPAAAPKPKPLRLSDVEANLARAYEAQANEETTRIAHPYADEYFDSHIDGRVVEEYVEEILPGKENVILVESVDTAALPVYEEVPEEYEESVTATPSRGRRLRKAPFARTSETVVEVESVSSVDGWKKGF